MSTYHQDDRVTLYHGKAVDVLRGLETGSVNCCVTSPPYYGLRDYGVEGQTGAEPTLTEYVASLFITFGEVYRVLANDGTLWLNLGDSYSNSTRKTGVPAKNLLGVPWRVAFALQDDRWILRNAVVWNKTNAMPESVTDRLSSRHEQLFMFSKRARYWFDLKPIREPSVYDYSKPRKRATEAWGLGTGLAAHNGSTQIHPDGKNPGDVWSIPTQPFPGAHFATFPVALAERCVQAGCKPDGTVLDPFSGSGTTGLAAINQGRKYVGIDLNSDYLDLSLSTRLKEVMPK